MTWDVATKFHRFELTHPFEGVTNRDASYVVLTVSISKLIDCWQRAGDLLPHASTWDKSLLSAVETKLVSGTDNRMPYVHMEARRERRLYGLLPDAKTGILFFTNGRHRTRVLEFLGAEFMPVCTEVGESNRLLRRFCT